MRVQETSLFLFTLELIISFHTGIFGTQLNYNLYLVDSVNDNF
jgi:hypothetical protein